MSVASFASAIIVLLLMDALVFRMIMRATPEAVSVKVAGGSPFGSGADKVLLYFRSAVAIYALYFTAGYFYMPPYIVASLSFWSVLSWILVAVYFTAAAMCSTFHRKEMATQSDQLAFYRYARLCQLLLTMCAATTLMLDLVFWTLLVPWPPEPVTDYYSLRNWNEHLLNFFLIFVDLALNSIPLKFADLSVGLLWPLAYVHFTFVRIAMTTTIRSCLVTFDEAKCEGGSVFPYFFMDTTKPEVSLWLVGLMLVFVVAHSAMWLLAALRCWLRSPEKEPADARLELPIASES